MTRAPASPARIATYVAVPVALVAGGVTAYFISTIPVQPADPAASGTAASVTAAVTGVPASTIPGTETACSDLLEALPSTLAERPRRTVEGRATAAAWGDPPVVLVCGVPRPNDLLPTSQLNGVNNVAWLTKNAVDTTEYGLPGENTLWTAVDRKVYIAVAIPASQDNASVVSPLSTIIDKALPAA